MADRDWEKLGWRHGPRPGLWCIHTERGSATVEPAHWQWWAMVWGPELIAIAAEHDSESAALTAASKALGLLEDEP